MRRKLKTKSRVAPLLAEKETEILPNQFSRVFNREADGAIYTQDTKLDRIIYRQHVRVRGSSKKRTNERKR